jgi:peptide/nickel transport system permease protein
LARFIGGRLAAGLIVLFGAVTISFVLVNVIGNPVDIIGGTNIPAEQRQALIHELGYDRPLGERYVEYLQGAVVGDFGTQYATGTPAIDAVRVAAPYTLGLVAAAIAASLAFAIPLSVLSVLGRGSRVDAVLTRGVAALQGIPEFFLGLVLILVFSVQLGLLPSVGYVGLQSLILPTMALTIPLIPVFVRLIRAQLLDVMAQDFVLALRARGLDDCEIVLRHGMRNVAVPTVSFLALQIGWMLGGTLIVENVFAWPGLGSLLVSSVEQRDLAVVQAVVVLVAAGYVLLNLAADAFAVLIDPRIRVQQ